MALALAARSASTPTDTTVPTIMPATTTTESSPTVEMTVAATAVSTPTAPAVIKSTQNSTLGTILVDSNGMTLYYFLNDTSGASNCSGNCAALWPPFLTNGTPTTIDTAVTGALGVFTRTDGSQQVTYAGSPLYYYSGDKAAGDANGQGLTNLWYAAPAAGIPTPMATSASTTGSTSAPSETPTP
jgi:predicted lipoprotein with Yx(FWY)xxD motif